MTVALRPKAMPPKGGSPPIRRAIASPSSRSGNGPCLCQFFDLAPPLRRPHPARGAVTENAPDRRLGHGYLDETHGVAAGLAGGAPGRGRSAPGEGPASGARPRGALPLLARRAGGGVRDRS